MLAAGAHALLRRRRPLVGRRLLAGEVALERHHARDREQQRLVDRDHARRRHLRVAARDEEVDERAAELVRGGRAVGHPIQVTARSRGRSSTSARLPGSASRSRPSDTADRTLSLQRSTTSAGASRCDDRRTRRVTAHDEPSPSANPTMSQNSRLNTQDAFGLAATRSRRAASTAAPRRRGGRSRLRAGAARRATRRCRTPSPSRPAIAACAPRCATRRRPRRSTARPTSRAARPGRPRSRRRTPRRARRRAAGALRRGARRRCRAARAACASSATSVAASTATSIVTTVAATTASTSPADIVTRFLSLVVLRPARRRASSAANIAGSAPCALGR